MTVPTFAAISGGQVHEALDRRENEIVDLVEEIYLLHSHGGTVNPPSTSRTWTSCSSAPARPGA
jgi:hypothetical protein